MNPGLCPEQAFWSRLSGPQQAWLISQLEAQHAPPAGGLIWSCEGIDIGWVSSDRAQDMVALLPGCSIGRGRLHWESAVDLPLQRSQALQAFWSSNQPKGD